MENNEKNKTSLEKQEENNIVQDLDKTIVIGQEELMEEQKEKNKTPKNNKGPLIIIITMFIIICCLVGYIVYDNSIKQNNNGSDKTEIKEEEEEKTKDNESQEENSENKNEEDNQETNTKKKLKVYKGVSKKYNDSAFTSTTPLDENDYTVTKYEITCRTDECEFSNDPYEGSVLVSNYALVKENGSIVLYNYVTNEIIYENQNIKDASLILGDALILFTNDSVGIFNLETNKLTVDTKYDKIKNFSLVINDVRGPSVDRILGDGIVFEKNGKEGVINYKTGEIILDFKYQDIMCHENKRYEYNSETKEYKTIIYQNQYCTYKNGSKLNMLSYNEDTKKITDLNYQVDKVYDISDDYGYIVVDNKTKLIDLNKMNVIQDNINPNNYTYYFGYNNRDKNIFYITFDKNDHTLPENQRCHEYYYNYKTHETGEEDHECGGIGKPVLYLYPEKTTKVTVDFAHNDLLTTTYPKFIDKWEVTAYPNGDLYDRNGKYYYGLYWEEKLVHKATFEEGFYVEKEYAIPFLEEKLTTIGLNDKERNEFIIYWLPILEKNEKSLVYFELTDERESVNKINISPKPDSLLRLVIHVKKVDKKTSIKEEKLTTFKRKGFTAVEWGGINY